MAAYLGSALTVRDQGAFQEYHPRAAAAIHAYDGHYLVRGGEISVLQVESPAPALVLVEFPDMETGSGGTRRPNTPRR